MRTRRAASLVELVVVMTACVAILSTSAVLMHRTLHAQVKARTFLAAQRSAQRLSAQFRQDVRQAKASHVEDLPAEVVLRLEQDKMHTVEYRHAQGIVGRTLLAGEKVVSREEYAFPAEIELSVRHEETPRRVVLSITTDPARAANADTLQAFATPVSLQVEACLKRGANQGESQ